MVEVQTKDLEKQIKKAITSLSTLGPVSVIKKSTSHFNFGTKEPFVNDRFDIQIQVGSKKDIYCQVIFDSTDYSFPPDIIFRKPLSLTDAFGTEDIAQFLPITWDMNDENCLRDWFSRLLALIKPPTPTESNSRNFSVFDNDIFMTDAKRSTEDDDFVVEKKYKGKQKAEEIFNWDVVQEKEEQKRKWEHVFDSENKTHKKGLFDLQCKGTKSGIDSASSPSKSRKLTQGSSSSFKKLSLKENPKIREWRKNFMVAWLQRFEHHIIKYDADNFSSFSLYLTFDISQDSLMWRQYYIQKKRKQAEFNSINNGNTKLCKPKPFAPMICNFTTDHGFPKCKLKITLISVLNTTDVGSAEPDSLNIEIQVDVTKHIPLMIKEISKYLAETAIKFHLLQNDE